MEKVLKKRFTFVIEKNISLEKFRNKYNKKYKPAWKAKLSDQGVALSTNESVNGNFIWWVSLDYFNENYIKIEEDELINEKGEISDDIKKLFKS